MRNLWAEPQWLLRMCCSERLPCYEKASFSPPKLEKRALTLDGEWSALKGNGSFGELLCAQQHRKWSAKEGRQYKQLCTCPCPSGCRAYHCYDVCQTFCIFQDKEQDKISSKRTDVLLQNLSWRLLSMLTWLLSSRSIGGLHAKTSRETISDQIPPFQKLVAALPPTFGALSSSFGRVELPPS